MNCDVRNIVFFSFQLRSPHIGFRLGDAQHEVSSRATKSRNNILEDRSIGPRDVPDRIAGSPVVSDRGPRALDAPGPEKGQKLTFELDPYSGAAQKLRKLTVNLDQLMQAGQGPMTRLRAGL
jgi:hypothetical protein